MRSTRKNDKKALLNVRFIGRCSAHAEHSDACNHRPSRLSINIPMLTRHFESIAHNELSGIRSAFWAECPAGAYAPSGCSIPDTLLCSNAVAEHSFGTHNDDGCYWFPICSGAMTCQITKKD